MKTNRDMETDDDMRNHEMSAIVFVLLAAACLIILVICISFVIATIRTGEMPSTDALITVLSHVLDLLIRYSQEVPPPPPDTL